MQLAMDEARGGVLCLLASVCPAVVAWAHDSALCGSFIQEDGTIAPLFIQQSALYETLLSPITISYAATAAIVFLLDLDTRDALYGMFARMKEAFVRSGRNAPIDGSMKETLLPQ